MTKALEHFLRLRYPTEIVEDEDGRYVATIPDLPGCASFGDTPDEAVRGVSEAKELWIKGRLETGQAVPEPTQLEEFSGKFVVRLPRSLHRSLDYQAKKQGTSLNQYIVHLLSERHMGDALKTVFEESVRATLAAMVRPQMVVIQTSPGEFSTGWKAIKRHYQCSALGGEVSGEYDPLDYLDMVIKPPKSVTKVVKQTGKSFFDYHR